MRIAVLTYGLPVPGQKRGGIERVAHMLADGLARRGHAVTVFSHDPKPAGAAYDVRTLPWKSFVNTWAGRRITMGYLGNIMLLSSDYREFDVLVAHGDSLLLPLKGKPVVRVMLGSAWGEAAHATSVGRFALQMGVYLQELLTAIAGARAVVGISENTRRHNPLISHVIPLGVDAAFQARPREKTPHPSIVYVGALRGRKRGAFLLDVFERGIRPRFSDAQLMFVGAAGPARAGVTYHTGVSDEELASLYRRAWVYASPSTYEGFGLPYLEAMACGTAVVATPNPGSREVLDGGVYGRLVSDEAFGGAVVDLLSRDDLRRAAEAQGMLRAAQFSADLMIDRYSALLAQVCEHNAESVASS